LSTQTVPLFFICLRNNCKFELYLSSLFASEIIVNLNCILPFFLIAAIIIVNSNLLLFLTQKILVKSWWTFFLYLLRQYSQVIPYLSSTVYWPREVIAKSANRTVPFFSFAGPSQIAPWLSSVFFAGPCQIAVYLSSIFAAGIIVKMLFWFFFSINLIIYERFEQQVSNQTVCLSMFCYLISEPKRTGIRMPLPEAEEIAPVDPTRRVHQLGRFHHF
jgi:hypothetical protein